MKNILIEASIETLKETIRLKPNFAEAHCSLGLIYSKTGDYQNAIACFKTAIGLKPH